MIEIASDLYHRISGFSEKGTVLSVRKDIEVIHEKVDGNSVSCQNQTGSKTKLTVVGSNSLLETDDEDEESLASPQHLNGGPNLGSFLGPTRLSKRMATSAIRGPARTTLRPISSISKARFVNGRVNRNVTILLLGCGESGKSTSLKSLRNLMTGDFAFPLQQDEWRIAVRRNLVNSMRWILSKFKGSGRSFADQPIESYASFLPKMDDENVAFEPILIEAIEDVYNDVAVQDLARYRYLSPSQDSALYFLASIRRIASPDYVPSVQDAFRARLPTTGIFETTVTRENTIYHVFDFGGAQSERKKWVHGFNCANVVVFHVPVDCYTLSIAEDPNVNMMEESLTLFDGISNSFYFSEALIILVFTKCDTLKTVLEEFPPTQTYSEYEGGGDAESFLDFLETKFLSLVQEFPRNLRTFEVRYTSIVNDVASQGRTILDAVELFLNSKLSTGL